MMNYLLALTLLLYSISGYTQLNDDFVFDKDSLNIKDEKGRKHGFSVRYLTVKLKPCKIDKAHYYGYELFDHGKRVQKFYYQRFKRRGKLKSQPNDPGTENPLLLDGTFEWYKRNGNIVSQEIFKGGFKFYSQSFKFSRKHPDEQVFTEHLYFDRLYGGKVGTFYYEQYTKGNLTFTGFFRKRDRGWRVYSNPKSNPKYNRDR